MKITTVRIEICGNYKLTDLISLIFFPDFSLEVPPIIECLRKFHPYIIGLQYIDNNIYDFELHFPKRSILLTFRGEFTAVEKELPK